MLILLRGVFVLILASFLCTSCIDSTSPVSLTLPENISEAAAYPSTEHAADRYIRSAPLKALNKNARAGAIGKPEKSGAMYFAFEQSPEILELAASGLYALELEFEPFSVVAKSGNTESINSMQRESFSKSGSIATITGAGFTAGLLYASDFSVSGKLKENLRSQHPVTAQTLPHGTFTVSIGFAGIVVQARDVRGFMVSSQAPLKLKSAAIVPVRYGWLKNKTAVWYGTTADGGVIPPELCTESGLPLRTDFPKPSAIIYAGNTDTDGRDTIVIHFDETPPITMVAEQKQPCLSFQCSGKHISVYRAPNVYRLTLDGCLFPDSLLTLEQTDTDRLATADIPAGTDGFAHKPDTATMVYGVTIGYTAPSPLVPITADPGLILEWPQEQWRHPSYELFAWEQFPCVLIFDFADYSVQDSYLKRLSFFAEKKGFTGRLLSDNAIASLHGFNAHDYKAETLASFFRKAEEERFPLNKSELHLRKILFHNDIIIRTESGIEAGYGAIVSISRQSPAYLRYRFITHECLHGIYFTEENFRDTVAKTFHQTDPRAVLFLRRYFEVYPTLQYDTDDDYLLQNEFMAYLLQQGSSSLQQYYTQMSRFHLIRQAEPALCRYIRNTKAEAFMQAAEQMSSFLYAMWGLRGGRIYLANMGYL